MVDRIRRLLGKITRNLGALGQALLAAAAAAATILAGLAITPTLLPPQLRVLPILGAAIFTGLLTFLQQRPHGATAVESINLPNELPVGRRLTPRTFNQLPPSVDDFIDRDRELRVLTSLLSKTTATIAPRRVILAGSAGVGKTALAVRTAERVSDSYPDGVLYINLRGAEVDCLAPEAVLERFLRDLGLSDSELPETIDDRVKIYWEMLSHRRLLIVLDNVLDESQVRPLIPSGEGNAVILTTRSNLLGLESTYLVNLQVFDRATSIEFLQSMTVQASRQRLDVADEVGTVADLCGDLPLALRIAGAKLAALPHLTPNLFAQRLEDEHRRLYELNAGDLDVRASLSISYAGLDPRDRRAFCLLGLLETADWPQWAISSLSGLDETLADGVIDRLVDAHLVESLGPDITGMPRFRFHDLIRVFARERLDAEFTLAERNEAIGRCVDTYCLLTCYAADTMGFGELNIMAAGKWQGASPAARPSFALDNSLAWFTVELSGVVSIIKIAYEAGFYGEVCLLIGTIPDFLELRDLWREWELTHSIGLDATQHLGDSFWEALIKRNLSLLRRYQGNPRQAIILGKASVTIFSELHDTFSEALALRILGESFHADERDDEAMTSWTRSLSLMRSLGDEHGEASVLREMGLMHLHRGDPVSASINFEASLPAFQTIRDSWCEAFTLQGLGEAHRLMQRPTESVNNLQSALLIFRDLEGLSWQAEVLEALARSYGDLSDWNKAISTCAEAIEIRSLLANPSAKEAAEALYTSLIMLSREDGLIRHARRIFGYRSR
jgi:tetratricopeptide (TPR) repeat protein